MGLRSLSQIGPEASGVVTPIIAAIGTITGTLTVGSTLTHSGLTVTGHVDTTARQWKADAVNIGGATGSTYLVTSAEAGKSITVTATVTNVAGSASGTTPGVSIPAAGWTPLWVDNNVTGYMTYDGTFTNGDGTTLEIVLLLKDLDGNGAVIQRIINNNGPRLDIRLETNGRLHFIVKNTSGVDLIDWTAGSTMKGAGAWLIRIAADTSGTPSFAVSRSQITGASFNVAGSWAAYTGTFTTGPVAGTMDVARSTTGVDWTVFATAAGGNILDNHCGYVLATNTVMGDAAYAASGLLVNPASIGSPFFRIQGPAASITDDTGSNNITLTATGSFTNA